MTDLNVVLKTTSTAIAADIQSQIAKIKSDYGAATNVVVQFEDATQAELETIRTHIASSAASVETLASSMKTEVTSKIMDAIADLKADIVAGKSAISKVETFVGEPLTAMVGYTIADGEAALARIEAMIAKLGSEIRPAVVTAISGAPTSGAAGPVLPFAPLLTPRSLPPIAAVAPAVAPAIAAPAMPKALASTFDITAKSIFARMFSGVFSFFGSAGKFAFSGLGTLLSAPLKLFSAIPAPGIKLAVAAALFIGVAGTIYAGYRFVENTQEKAINSAVEAAQDAAAIQMQTLSAKVMKDQAEAQAKAQEQLLEADRADAAKTEADQKALQDRIDAIKPASVPVPVVTPALIFPEPAKPVKHKKKVKKHVASDGLSDGDAGVNRLLESASNLD